MSDTGGTSPQPEQQPPTHEGWPPPTHTPPPHPPSQAYPGYQGYPPGAYPGQGQPAYYPGQPYGGYPSGGSAPEDPGAQNSLIVGIVSLALGLLCGVGFLGSPFALVMGLRAKRRIEAARGALSGRGNAQAGFVLGLVGTILLALAVLAFVLVVILIIAGISAGDFESSEGTAA